MLSIQRNQTCYVSYNATIDIVEQKDRVFYLEVYHQVHLFIVRYMYTYYIIIEKKNIRGMNGGLSKGLVIHPFTDPLPKFDGSFISF